MVDNIQAPRIPKEEMRVVVLTDQPGRIANVLETRCDRAEVQLCGRYRDLAPLLDSFRPNVLLAYKIKGDPDAFPAEPIVNCPSLLWAHIGGAGVDHMGGWDAARLTVTNSSGIHKELMAQYVTAAMVFFTQHLALYMRQQQAHHWQRRDCINLRGKTAVVVGFGNIGQEIGRVAHTFGMHVIGIRTRPKANTAADEVLSVDRLADAARQADFFILSLPLTSQTRGLIGASILDALKPGGVLINVARGGIVDEEALLASLGENRLAGAVIDVFEEEPLPPDSPFWDMENVIVTPHSSSDFAGWERAVADLFCDNCERMNQGSALINGVSPTRGY